jgi:hypothetical protein
VVNQDYRVGLSKSGSNGKPQEVIWIDTQNGGPWTITFDKTSTAPSTFQLQPGSPFNDATFTIQNGASGSSGLVRANATVPGTYRYNVRNASGTITDDPDIDTEP